MGYELYITAIRKTDDVKVNPFKVERDTPLPGGKGINVSWMNFIDTEVKENGVVKTKYSSGKFYDAEDFAKLLAMNMENGKIEIEFCGEEGECFGYVVAPKAVVLYDVTEYGREYHHPMLENGNELYMKLTDRRLRKDDLNDSTAKKSTKKTEKGVGQAPNSRDIDIGP